MTALDREVCRMEESIIKGEEVVLMGFTGHQSVLLAPTQLALSPHHVLTYEYR